MSITVDLLNLVYNWAG